MQQSATLDELERRTFSGRRFTKEQLRQVVDTVSTFQNLSVNELALTICEHFDWRNHGGSLKIQSCLSLLENLEASRTIKLPPRRVTAKPKSRKVIISAASDPRTEIVGSLDDLGVVELQLVASGDDLSLFNQYIDRYHYLGYRQPVGQSLRYFVIAKDRGAEKLGCLFFTPSAFVMKARDEWIGWKDHQRVRHLQRVIANKRFLILPWVKVPNLASTALSLIQTQVPEDWFRLHGCKPVLIETFVDPSKFFGTCYQASNWQLVGPTNPRSGYGGGRGSAKDIYALPLAPNFRETLKGLRTKVGPQKALFQPPQKLSLVDEAFTSMWIQIMAAIREVADKFDESWQKRRRVIDSMMLVLLIFRLIASKDRRGYGSTIDELWDNCQKLQISLPQPEGVAASSFSVARRKLSESIFKDVNARVLAIYEEMRPDCDLWHGHRLYAVDGSKLNLPFELRHIGYKAPSAGAYYPQGLVSCLYRLRSAMPADFGLYRHKNERRCAEEHLLALRPGDAVVYDRGYFSYALLQRHINNGVHPIFRLKRGGYRVIQDFWDSPSLDETVTIDPNAPTRRMIQRVNPGIEIKPIQLRLIKYRISGETYCLGTTIFDQNIQPPEFQDVYHSRWGIEELYKVSKQVFAIEQFHAKTERGVMQELYAHFALITINRIIANHADQTRPPTMCEEQVDARNERKLRRRTNFKSCVGAFFRSMEQLLVGGVLPSVKRVGEIIKRATRRSEPVRPGRSYERISFRPAPKWQGRTKVPGVSLSPG